MNIFQKLKNYNSVEEELDKTKKLLNDVQVKLTESDYKYRQLKTKYENYIKYSQDILNEFEISKQLLKDKIRSLHGAKGGLITENNKLKAKVSELTEQLKDAMSDKYLVKRIPMGRMPKGQVMKMKSHAKQDKIIQKVYERLEKEE